ncbi:MULTISPECIES: hypothetical protein [unclassified Roseofilum]|uniref:hypothetical protein n=1 Tax=unclassified Roseofilum TaxID=2620099 RepID=UPI000E8DE5A9|nr:MULTISPECIES: hypothetical protein [unclassified Roseofilum]MBP0009968.1 hypothetical protein [Roseofilum sp. Belize Diploria]MBP0034364.1 hypothetical protein [Roseofilum sp. Belize BBD 4]MBP0043885.1 hypothetical protein [Roseofilum sp. SBFL]HBQ99754.1 hypothetical protein [Cyanobacteria bacterium UBA11691]
MNTKKHSSNIHPIWNWVNWLSFPILLFIGIHLLQVQDRTPQSTFSVPPQSLELETSWSSHS